MTLLYIHPNYTQYASLIHTPILVYYNTTESDMSLSSLLISDVLMLYGYVAPYIACCYNQTLFITVILSLTTSQNQMLSVSLLINHLCLCAILIS